jgi:hypothetical protein
MGQLAQTCLVNSGQDTLITLLDGSTIVVKGVTRIDAVFPTVGGVATSEPSPIRGEIGDDGKRAHHRWNGGEGVDGIAK